MRPFLTTILVAAVGLIGCSAKDAFLGSGTEAGASAPGSQSSIAVSSGSDVAGATPSNVGDGTEAGAASMATSADVANLPPPTSSLFLTIDDMETHVGLPQPPNSSGFWWGSRLLLGNWFFGSAGSDPTPPHGDAPRGDMIPPARAVCLTHTCWSQHVQGDMLASGVDMWAQLMHPSNGPVDLSSYAGIAFWARLASPSGRLIVALRAPPGLGYPFLAGEATGSPWYAQSLTVSDQWERFILLFDDFHQGVISGNTSGGALETAAVSDIDFIVGLGGESFDLWINDLELLCRGVCRPVACPYHPECP